MQSTNIIELILSPPKHQETTESCIHLTPHQVNSLRRSIIKMQQTIIENKNRIKQKSIAPLGEEKTKEDDLTHNIQELKMEIDDAKRMEDEYKRHIYQLEFERDMLLSQHEQQMLQVNAQQKKQKSDNIQVRLSYERCHSWSQRNERKKHH